MLARCFPGSRHRQHTTADAIHGAELRSTFSRERLAFEADLVSGIEWVLPDRPLTAEFAAALHAGELRGADLWHVAAALYIAGEAERLSFVTLDQPQRDAAVALGFRS